MTSRRTFCAFAALAACAPATIMAATDAPLVEVWKTPTCGCCRVWIRHLQDAGFRVRATEMDDVGPVKARLGVPPALASCHTALVEGYVVEGHVPADDIIRLLRQKPAVKGLLVPGMPIGSPGMEGPGAEPYDVLALDAAGDTRVFATHRP